VLGKLTTKEIRHVNDEVKTLITNTCGMETHKKKMLAFGNRRNILTDYDQTKHFQNGFFIFRLY